MLTIFLTNEVKAKHPVEQLQHRAYMLLRSLHLEVIAKEAVLNGLIVLQHCPLHKKVGHGEHAVEVASGKVPFKLAVVDFRAKIIRLFVEALFVIVLNGGDHLNEEVECALHSLLMVFYLLSDFVEQEFEVLFVVKILDHQTHHMVEQLKLALGRKGLLADSPQEPEKEGGEDCIGIVGVFIKDLSGNAKKMVLSFILPVGLRASWRLLEVYLADDYLLHFGEDADPDVVGLLAFVVGDEFGEGVGQEQLLLREGLLPTCFLDCLQHIIKIDWLQNLVNHHQLTNFKL
jgi:hypothetical protein